MVTKAKKRLGIEIYNALVAAYRIDPGNPAHASKHAGTTWNKAQKAWEEGLPVLNLPPIRRVLEEEMEQARARLQAEIEDRRTQAEKDAELATKHALEARQQEGKMVKLARSSATEALMSAQNIAAMTRKLSKELVDFAVLEANTLRDWTAYNAALLRGEDPPNRPGRTGMPPEKVLAMARQGIQMCQESIMMAKTVMDMERLHLGAPNTVIGITTTGPGVSDDLTMEEAELRIAAAQQAVEQVRRIRGLPFQTADAEAIDVVEEPEELIGEAVEFV